MNGNPLHWRFHFLDWHSWMVRLCEWGEAWHRVCVGRMPGGGHGRRPDAVIWWLRVSAGN